VGRPTGQGGCRRGGSALGARWRTSPRGVDAGCARGRAAQAEPPSSASRGAPAQLGRARPQPAPPAGAAAQQGPNRTAAAAAPPPRAASRSWRSQAASATYSGPAPKRARCGAAQRHSPAAGWCCRLAVDGVRAPRPPSEAAGGARPPAAAAWRACGHSGRARMAPHGPPPASPLPQTRPPQGYADVCDPHQDFYNRRLYGRIHVRRLGRITKQCRGSPRHATAVAPPMFVCGTGRLPAPFRSSLSVISWSISISTYPTAAPAPTVPPQDCWNRPIASAPGAWIDVMEREDIAGNYRSWVPPGQGPGGRGVLLRARRPCESRLARTVALAPPALTCCRRRARARPPTCPPPARARSR
jgi:hypothetical protein